MDGVNIKKIKYGSLGNCISISNSIVEVVVTVDMGPRIIRYGFLDGPNEFGENIPVENKVDGGIWRLIGGHRLWHSPEDLERTYVPDDLPVFYEEIPNGIKVIQNVEKWAQIQKSMDITLEPDSSRVSIKHILINKNAWNVKFAAWGLSVMAKGGVEVIPQPDRETGLLANRNIAIWPYSRMTDSRFKFMDNYMVLKQDENNSEAFKIGINNEKGWAAYFNHSNAFIKKFKHILNGKYPDSGMSFETYTNNHILEMESLSPLYKVAPGDFIEHTEEWELIKGLNIDYQDESSIKVFEEKYIK